MFWFIVGNATKILLFCPCNSEDCSSFDDDGTEVCGCRPGYEQHIDNQSCTGIMLLLPYIGNKSLGISSSITDIDECSSNTFDCGNGSCLNVLGSYICVCLPGYVFNLKERQCIGKYVLHHLHGYNSLISDHIILMFYARNPGWYICMCHTYSMRFVANEVIASTVSAIHIAYK